MSDPANANPAARPNIVLILADDMGYSDIGCFGSEIRTPHLDRLAAGGTRFTQMYNCARCCPTRASLLTGLYPHQAGVGLMTGNAGIPAYQGWLNDRCVTIAEALRASGYATGLSGKWHVGGDYDPLRRETWEVRDAGHPRPLDRGFDRFYGTLDGYGNYFNPHTLLRDNEIVEPEGDSYYYTDAVAENACGMIEDFTRAGEPFFLYTAFTAPHWPLHAHEEDIERYRGRYAKGWDATRTERHERLVAMGLLDSKWPISPRDEKAPPWGDVREKEWEDLRMAVYAAQVDRMDQGIGRIVATLERLGALDNTLILFLSDNGGCAEFMAENGWLDSRLLPTREGSPVRLGNSPAILPGPADTFTSYDLPWANLSNTPFRLYKHWIHEGGISTPLIAHWPASITAGGIVHEPCNVIDLMPTCLDAARAAYPEERNGQAVRSLEGLSLVPAMRGAARSSETPLFWEHEGNAAVRLGQWKLVRKHPGPWELYDMREDRTELNDLAAGEPDRTKEMAGLYDEWALRCDVRPWEEIVAIHRRKR